MENMSSEIGKLAEALAKAQAAFVEAPKDRDANLGTFRYSYSSLASVWAVARKPLSDNGLAVVQTTRNGDGTLTVITMLVHSSGQWIAGELSMVPQSKTPQAYGSALTYARRYGLTALLGLVSGDEDDDGAKASTPAQAKATASAPKSADADPGIGPDATAITRADATATHAALMAVAEPLGVSRDDVIACEREVLTALGAESMGKLTRGQLSHYTWRVGRAIRALVPEGA